jgi:hypothetical protein
VSENRVLKRIFGEVARNRRRLHNEGFHNLYTSKNIITVIKVTNMRWAGHAIRMAEMRSVYKIVVGKPEGKRPL